MTPTYLPSDQNLTITEPDESQGANSTNVTHQSLEDSVFFWVALLMLLIVFIACIVCCCQLCIIDEELETRSPGDTSSDAKDPSGDQESGGDVTEGGTNQYSFEVVDR